MEDIKIIVNEPQPIDITLEVKYNTVDAVKLEVQGVIIAANSATEAANNAVVSANATIQSAQNATTAAQAATTNANNAATAATLAISSLIPSFSNNTNFQI